MEVGGATLRIVVDTGAAGAMVGISQFVFFSGLLKTFSLGSVLLDETLPVSGIGGSATLLYSTTRLIVYCTAGPFNLAESDLVQGSVVGRVAPL